MNGQDVELRVHVLGAHARCLNSVRDAAACRSVRDCLLVCQRCKALLGVGLVAVAWQRRNDDDDDDDCLVRVCQRLLAGLSEMQIFAWRWLGGSRLAAPQRRPHP